MGSTRYQCWDDRSVGRFRRVERLASFPEVPLGQIKGDLYHRCIPPDALPRTLNISRTLTPQKLQSNRHTQIKIQRFTSAAQRGAPQEDHLYHHVEHCLDSLLQDVYCHADDTPWFELPPKGSREGYEPFQTRQCKNWDQLVDWAAGYHSCYQDVNVTDANGVEVKSEYEHYTFCPDGSEYIPEMERYYRTHEMHRTGFQFSQERGVEK